MKSTKVQTLGKLCMRDTANDGLGYQQYVFTRGLLLVACGESDTGQLYTIVDSMRESIHALLCD